MKYLPEIMSEIERKKAIKAREKAIKREKTRLEQLYSDVSDKKKKTIDGLIERAAFMRVSLTELEEDINENGLTEKFSQGGQEPYQRERPAARIYNSMNTGYQKIIKQLTDLLPKDAPPPEKDDGFEGFINGREDV